MTMLERMILNSENQIQKTENSKWTEIAQSAFEAAQMRKKYADIEKQLLNDLKELSQNESMSCEEYKFEKIERKGSVDYGSIDILKGIDLDSYRKDPVYSWKLTKI